MGLMERPEIFQIVKQVVKAREHVHAVIFFRLDLGGTLEGTIGNLVGTH